MSRHCELLDCPCDDERCEAGCIEQEFLRRIGEETAPLQRDLENARMRLHLCDAARRGAMKDCEHLGRIVSGFRTLILERPVGDKAAWKQMKAAIDAWVEDRDPPGEHFALIPRHEWTEIVSRIDAAHLALNQFVSERSEERLTDVRFDVYRLLGLVRAQKKRDCDGEGGDASG